MRAVALKETLRWWEPGVAAAAAAAAEGGSIIPSEFSIAGELEYLKCGVCGGVG